MSNNTTRRDFLRGRLFGGAARVASAVAAPLVAMNEVVEARTAAKAQVAPPKKSVFIVARNCLAYQSFCSVCAEHCPVSGAIKIENGRPFVQAETCTACGKCQEVCPAPRNAIVVMNDPGADPGARGMGADDGGVAAFLPTGGGKP